MAKKEQTVQEQTQETENKFVSLTELTPYETKKGTKASGRVFASLAKDAVVRKAGNGYVVSSFMNLQNVAEDLNKAFGTKFVESEQYHSVPANYTVFTYTEAEAEKIAERLEKYTSVRGLVDISIREHEGKHYIDLTPVGMYYQKSERDFGVAADEEQTEDAALALEDDDLPF